MGTAADYVPSGVIPATLLAFDADYVIDEGASRRHLRHVADTRGISAITVNGHASEVHACTSAEQQRVLEFSLEECGDELPLVNGVYADGSLEAARIARMSQAAGASALLVFPPQSMTMGGQLRPEMARAHLGAIAAASDLPIILFQYPMASGLGYPFDTLMTLVEEIPQIRAIKDWCNDPALHERHIRALQVGERPINVLTTHSAWLLGSLCMGPNGLLSGAGSVVADLQVAMFEAVRASDLATARAVNDRYVHVAQAFYAPPFLDMHNRMKECLALLGRIDEAIVRPPLAKLHGAEIERLEAALRRAGVEREGAVPVAA